MKHYRNILIAIDGSPADEHVLDHGISLAKPLSATLHLLHVIHSHTIDQERCMREKIATQLTAYRRTITAAGVQATTIIRSGEPEEEILKETAAHQYDLAIIGLHGHTFPERLLYGSVSRKVREKITIPLLLVNA